MSHDKLLECALPPESAEPHVAPDILRAVFAHLRTVERPVTPENFAWSYRQVQRERRMDEPTLQYVSHLGALQHALVAFRDLLIGDAWLGQRFDILAGVVDGVASTEEAKLGRVRFELEHIERGKREVLQELAIVVAELRGALVETIANVEALSGRLSDTHRVLDRHRELAEQCDDPASARRVLDLLAADVRRLRSQVAADHGKLRGHASTVAAGARFVFGAAPHPLEQSGALQAPVASA